MVEVLMKDTVKIKNNGGKQWGSSRAWPILTVKSSTTGIIGPQEHVLAFHRIPFLILSAKLIVESIILCTKSMYNSVDGYCLFDTYRQLNRQIVQWIVYWVVCKAFNPSIDT
jgi:hypothetical protein